MNNPKTEISFSDKCRCLQKPRFKFDTFDASYKTKLLNKFVLHLGAPSNLTQLQKVLTITHWVNTLWKHNGDTISASPDALSILTEVLEHKKQFRCVEYATVLHACLNALNIPARIVRLKTADCQTREYGAGHVICEAYLDQFKKWIMIDPQENVVPVMENIPLNAVELLDALNDSDSKFQFTSLPGLIDKDDTDVYKVFIKPYLYYFQTDVENSYTPKPDQESLMLVPQEADKPKIFQKKYPLLNVVYTSCKQCFYQKP